MSNTNQHLPTPKYNNADAHWADVDHRGPINDNTIESSVGDRSGEVFKGRCLQGDNNAYINVSSFVSGTLTAKVWWIKNNTDSLSNLEIADLGSPQITLTSEVDNTNKYIVLDTKLYYGVHIYDNGDLKAIYTGEEGNGVTLYDISGNGNDGTVVNLYSGFHAENSNVPYSFLNEKGYNLSGSTAIPASLTQPNLDVLGNPLENRGKVRLPLEFVDNNCLYADGTNYVENDSQVLNKSFTDGIISLGFYLKIDSNFTQGYFIDLANTSGSVGIRELIINSDQTIRVVYRDYSVSGGGGNNKVDSTETLTLDEWVHIKFTYDAREFNNDLVKLYVHENNREIIQIDVIDEISSMDEAIFSFTTLFGRNDSAGVSGVSVAGFEIKGLNEDQIHNITPQEWSEIKPLQVLPISEGNGSVLHGYDYENNQSFDTNIINFASSQWQKQDVYAYNALEGGYLNTANVADEDWFIIEVDTTITDTGTTDANTIELSSDNNNSSGFEGLIDWGDGQIEYVNALYFKHTYESGGAKSIRVYAFYDNNTDDDKSLSTRSTADKIKWTAIRQWGNYLLSTHCLLSASNMEVTATDVPDTSQVGSLQRTFDGCSSITNIPNIDQWDVSNVSTFRRAFNGCVLFDGIGVGSWDVSNVSNFESAFSRCDNFNVNLSSWDVSSGTDFRRMFYNASSFNNGDIAGTYNTPLTWDVSSAQDTGSMFQQSAFGQELKAVNGVDPWDVSNVTNFGDFSYSSGMFALCPFNQYIGDWDTSSANNISEMFFRNTDFNQNLSQKSVTNGYGTYDAWDLSNVTNAKRVFREATSFNNGESVGSSTEPLLWNTSNFTTIAELFRDSAFEQDLYASNGIDPWDTSQITTMDRVFRGCSNFNSPSIINWNTELVERMMGMFMNTNFDQPIVKWNTSSVITFGFFFQGGMFENCPFNQDISTKTINAGQPDEYVAWDVSNGTSFRAMFKGNSDFNQDLNTWDFNPTVCEEMFEAALSFNNGESIGSETNPLTWTTPNIVEISDMFPPNFTQDIRSFNFSNVIDADNFISDYPTNLYDNLLIELDSQTLISGTIFDFGNAQYTSGSAAETARTNLINDGIIIQDGGSI